MAAFYGEGIDNVLVGDDTPEIQLWMVQQVDFVDAIRSIGIEEQNIRKIY